MIVSENSEIGEKIGSLLYHLLRDVLLDVVLKSAVFELEICSLHQNGIEFHQATHKVCFRIEITAKRDIWQQFLFTDAFLLICTHAGPVCSGVLKLKYIKDLDIVKSINDEKYRPKNKCCLKKVSFLPLKSAAVDEGH